MAQTTTLSGKSVISTTAPLANTSQSQWAQAWRRLRRNKAAVAGFCIIVFFVLVAILAPLISPQNPLEDHSGKDYSPPFWQAASPAGKTFDPRFILGTDDHGRDVLSRLIYGTRTSLMVGLLPVALILIFGCLIGFVSGLAGGWVDNLLMRVTDVFYAFPDVLFLILAQVAFGDTVFGKTWNGLLLFMMSLALISWVGLARLTRGSTLTIKGRDYIDAARGLGLSNWQIMMRHVLPNSLSVIVVWAAFAIPSFVLTETVLGFLGIGLKPAIRLSEIFIASWGRLLLDGRSNFASQPWFMGCTAIVIAIFVVAFTFFGDGLRDALDPRQK